ncbi:MAG: ChaN family lipoprotein, partial [Deltaproteobacteria bacterium]|nr:ChaN family lipoprotein [Deltaproteobacteria bacterium]
KKEKRFKSFSARSGDGGRFMKRFRLPIIISSLLALFFFLRGYASTVERILRVSDGKVLSLSELTRDLIESRLVFVGEIHTYQNHHHMQLETIRAIKNAGAPVAIGLEMFRRDSQTDLDRWVEGELSEKEFQKIYYKNWNYPWPLYRDIFLFARDHNIPMVGLNVPPEITKQVAREGFASLSPKQRGDLPMVTCRVDPEYMAFVRRSLGMHGHGGMEFTNFCEAQLVWDTAMAWTLLRFLEKDPKATVVVIAGKGHSWKLGIPAQIKSRSTLPFRVILPEIPGRVERGNISMAEADYVWLGLK